MRRIIVIAVLIGGIGSSAADRVSARDAVALREFVAIESDVVRLGDLFDPAGDHAASVIGRAPAPGRRDVYDAERLRTIARNFGLAWSPASRFERSVVERTSRLIDRREIEESLIGALIAQGLPMDHKIELANRNIRVFAPQNASVPFTVQGVFLDDRTGQFTATLVVPASDGTSPRVPLSGRSYTVVETPVLKRRMSPGEVIRADDIAWAKLPASAVPGEALSEIGAIAGRTPRRPLREGIPVLTTDLRLPIQVAKGSSVLMSIETSTMQITARGQATEDGANGETIRILNPQSNRTVEGVVTGPGRVRVGTPALALR